MESFISSIRRGDPVAMIMEQSSFHSMDVMKLQLSAVADPGFFKGGFSFSLTKTPAQFELKTKKKGHQPSYFSLGSILHLLLDNF